MKLLLKSEVEDVVSGVAGLDLLDLRNANDQDLARVARMAWAVKRLFSGFEKTNPSNAKLFTDGALGIQIDPYSDGRTDRRHVSRRYHRPAIAIGFPVCRMNCRGMNMANQRGI